MSKEFKQQDYFRYKRLGKKWRRPRGLQSKLKVRKGGSGRVPGIGYRTALAERGRVDGMETMIVYTVADVERAAGKGIFIGATVGAKKTRAIAEQAKRLNIRVLNMKKVRRVKRVEAGIKKNKELRAVAKKKKEEKREKKEEKKEKKEGAKPETKDAEKKEAKIETKSEKKEEQKQEHAHNHTHEEHSHEHAKEEK